ncbi:MAG TPA: hypothetical protein VNH46_00430, partial [Gemmatimonadales bacterium]|nr:hypothetical protein [Gemmatimonadales bacterium]
RGQQTRDALQGATTDPTTASPFLPTSTSTAGEQIVNRIRGLQDTLSNLLGVAGFGGDPVLPTDRLSQQNFASVLADPAGPYALFPLQESRISRMGDMDIGATYTVVDRFDRNNKVGGFRLAAQALLRLPTGQLDDPSNLLDVGTGNGRYELGLSGTADLGSGRWGARLSGGYLFRFAALRVRRVGPFDQPYLTADRLTNVRLKAGDVLHIGARPFFRLTSNFAIMGVADYWHEAAGSASYPAASDSVPGVPAGLLASGSGSTLALGGGVTYVGRATGECQPGHHCGFPIDATWSYTNVFWGRGGPVNQYRTTRLEIRWYQRLWR